MLYLLNWKREEAGGQGREREGESGDKEEEEEGNITIKDRKERKKKPCHDSETLVWFKGVSPE